MNIGKGQDAFITTIKQLRIKLEDMETTMTDDPFMIHVLSNLTCDYDFKRW